MSADVVDPAAFAALICEWCLDVGPADRVLVGSSTLAEPLAVELHRAILERDAWPLVWLSPPSLSGDFYRYGRQRHFDEPSPIEMALVGGVDKLVRIDAPANANELAAADPTLVARAAAARGPLLELTSSRRTCRTLLPTPALAQQAAMSTAEYAEFVNRALFLDRGDPIAAWRDLSAAQERLVARLTTASDIRIEAEGTDLWLEVAGRSWINSDGKRNMPSGEVFTGPHERSAEGTIRFTVPTGSRGAPVDGVELTFREGEVVQARAHRGQSHLNAALNTDAGARRLGEIGIGTNVGIDRPTGHILLDEKMAGTVHLALGRSYPETGGQNPSALHWDLICDLREGGRLSADGETVVHDGAVVG